MQRKRRRGVKKTSDQSIMLSNFERGIPYYDIIDDEQAEDFLERALQVLEKIGCDFRDETAIAQWKDAGLSVENGRVRFTADYIRDVIAKVPGEYTHHARTPARSSKIGGRHMSFGPTYASPFMRDVSGERRYCNMDDFHKLLKITQMSPALDTSGGPIVEPVDIPVPKRHLDITYEHLRYSDKPFMGMVTSQVQAEDCIKMCQFAFGEDFVNDNPVMVSLFNCTSPLTWDTTMLDAMRIYARHNQIIILSPFPMTGASAPITVAGSVVQIIAEALAGIAYVQLIRPGCPCLFGISTLITSMKTGGVLYGSAEANHISCIGSKIVRQFGIPIRMNGFKNNAMDSDIEAGYQSMQTFMMPALAGGNYFTHCAGWIESALSTCYIKFITDLEQITIMQRLLAGFDLSKGAMAFDAIEEVGPGGNYIGSSHTLERFRAAFYEPELQTTFTYEQWSEEGKPSVSERALALLSKKLEEYEDPGIDPGLDEVLTDFVRRRHEELPDSMD